MSLVVNWILWDVILTYEIDDYWYLQRPDILDTLDKWKDH